jgi:hypothetical protein
LCISYPQHTPPNAGGHETHARPLAPFSGAGHESLRASVDPTEASIGCLARFGRIDRSIQDVSSRSDMLCTFVTLDS